MQQALLFAQSVRALQSAKAWSPDVCNRIMQWRAAQGSNVASASKSVGRTRCSFARAASAQDLSTSSIDQQCATLQPAIPLCERPAEHTAPLADLLAWREAAEQQVAAVGTSWEREDDGPSMEDLQVGAGSQIYNMGLLLRCMLLLFTLQPRTSLGLCSPAPHRACAPRAACRRNLAGCLTTPWLQWPGLVAIGGPPVGGSSSETCGYGLLWLMPPASIWCS